MAWTLAHEAWLKTLRFDDAALAQTFSHYRAIEVGLDAHLAAVESDLTVYIERGLFAETVGRLSAYRGISEPGALTLSVVIKPGATGTVLPVEDQDATHPESALPATTRRRPLLIAGIPRTGSTWTKVILSHDPSILEAVNEPDSETKSAPAIWAKRRLGRYPVLVPGDRDADYQELWRWVLAGTPQSRRLEAAERVRKVALKEWRWYVKGHWTPTMRLAGQLGRHPGDQPVPELRDRRLLIKSVHAAMSVQWLAATFDLEVLVLLRHPAAVLASWQSLGLPEHYVRLERVPEVRRRCEEWGVPLPGPDELEHTVWLLGVLLTSLEQAARDSGFALRTHEQMCLSPVDEFRALYRELGLEWTDMADHNLYSLNRPGQGWTVERAAQDQPDLWKTRLSPATVDVMQRVLAPFPFRTWTAEDLQLSPGP